MIAADLSLVIAGDPPVADVLDVDREYRQRSAADELRTPVLHTARGWHRYTAMYSNTPRAHQLGRSHDWVIVYAESPEARWQYTVVTERKGLLARRRVVRGREVECARHYHLPRRRFATAERGAGVTQRLPKPDARRPGME